MDFNNHINEIVERILDPMRDVFVVDIQVKENMIGVVLDSDKNLTLSECAHVNRELQRELDLTEKIFSIKVMSAGIGQDLKMKRQYIKNVGKNLKINTRDNQIVSGKISQADDKKIELTWSCRKKKEIGKGKRTVEFKRVFEYAEINSARVII